ncbi:hypothetical protein pb186bvf_001693 [Paramecium bursaria]
MDLSYSSFQKIYCGYIHIDCQCQTSVYQIIIFFILTQILNNIFFLKQKIIVKQLKVKIKTLTFGRFDIQSSKAKLKDKFYPPNIFQCLTQIFDLQTQELFLKYLTVFNIFNQILEYLEELDGSYKIYKSRYYYYYHLNEQKHRTCHQTKIPIIGMQRIFLFFLILYNMILGIPHSFAKFNNKHQLHYLDQKQSIKTKTIAYKQYALTYKVEKEQDFNNQKADVFDKLVLDIKKEDLHYQNHQKEKLIILNKRKKYIVKNNQELRQETSKFRGYIGKVDNIFQKKYIQYFLSQIELLQLETKIEVYLSITKEQFQFFMNKIVGSDIKQLLLFNTNQFIIIFS